MRGKTAVAESFGLTQYMTREHEEVEGMLKRFQTLYETHPDAALEFFSRIKEKLFRHIAWEEEILFPLFEERVPLPIFGPTRNLRVEHRELLTLLAHLESAQARRESTAEVLEENVIEKRILEIFKAHQEKEDQILFPWLDTVLGEREKEDLIDKMRENR